ncbi:MAG: hypothetical protein Q4A65_05395 [Bacillota bacterium]|nr:hypothetical protein [Bacillota bacterium]
MSNELADRYTEQNLIDPTSPAYLTYMLLEEPEMIEMHNKMIEESEETEEEKSDAEKIKSLSTEDDFFKRMRKPVAGRNRQRFYDAMKQNEGLITEMVKRRIMTSLNDNFIEAATAFFAKCEADHTQWIFDHYRDMRSPYTQSMMCLVLGIRGCHDIDAFLMKQELTFMETYPEERFEQGPIIALYLLHDMKEYLSLNK